MDRDISSEEKLLGLIRDKDRTNTQRRGKEEFRAHRQRDFGKEFFQRPRDPVEFINRVLVVLMVAGVGYFGIKGLTLETKKTDVMTIDTLDPSQEILPTMAADVAPLSYYEEIAAQRDIFNTTFQKPTQPIFPDQASGSVAPVDPLRNLRLVGVVLAQPSQAIIEDSEAQETLFLFKGDSVRGLTVADIGEGKVTFLYQGQKIELPLP